MSILGSLSKIASNISNVGVGLAQALTGNFHALPSKKGAPKDIQPIDVDSVTKATTILGLIYSTLVRAREEELAERAELENDQNKQKELDDSRNEELIKALTVRRKPKKKLVKKPEEKEEPTKAPPTKAPTKKGPPKVEAEAPTAPPKVEPTPVKPPTAGKIISGAAVAGTTALLGKEALAANISKFESGSAGYNAYNKGTVGNKMIPSDKPIDFSKMTISEYLSRGNLPSGDPDKIFAVGRYQIIPKTMKALVKKLNIDPDTTFLDPPTQDSLFSNGLVKAIRKKVDDYVTGRSDDRDGAILQLAQEFASVGIPYDMKVGNKQLKRGDSYYSGVGGNKAHNSPDDVGAALDADRMKNLKKVEPRTNIDSGVRIDQSSKENRDMKSAAELKSQTNVNTTNITSAKNSATQSIQQEEVDDRRPMDKKS